MASIQPDLLWKGIIESLIEDFLLLFYPKWSQSIDFSRGFEFLDKELIQLAPESADTRRVTDKLIKVFLKDGSETWVLIHVEVQGYKDKAFPKRLFIYYYRLLDRYGVAVTTLAVLVDAHKKFHPRSYETTLAGTSMQFRFNTYKLLDHSLEALQKLDNPFARILEVSRIALNKRRLTDEHLFELKIGMVRRLKASGYATGKIRQIMNFLRHYVRFKNKQIISRFEEQIDIIFETSSAMGLEEIMLEEARKEGKLEGLEEGKKEGKQEEKLKLIYNSWQEGLSTELTAKLTGFPVEQVLELFKRFSSEKDEG